MPDVSGMAVGELLPQLGCIGSGTLIINAKDGTCTFYGVTIEPLLIAGELRAWLANDLQDNQIPLGAISTATLTVRLVLTPIEGRERATPVQYLSVDGKTIRNGGCHRLTMKCESRIATDEANYT